MTVVNTQPIEGTIAIEPQLSETLLLDRIQRKGFYYDWTIGPYMQENGHQARKNSSLINVFGI